MRILVHDYCGHPFQIQLSRTLAARGHTTLHLYSASLQTPHGNLSVLPNPTSTITDSLQICGISLPSNINKYSPLKRYAQEFIYARLLAKEIALFKPDIVLSSNTPLAIQQRALKATKKSGGRFIFWLQDLLGIGIANLVTNKIPFMGKIIARYFINLECRLIEQSDALVSITEDFCVHLRRKSITLPPTKVITNWAPLAELPTVPKKNPWSERHGFSDGFNFVYSGTLGLKHNTDLLLTLAQTIEKMESSRLIVFSEGLGAHFLRERKKALNLTSLHLFDYVPFHELPLSLASADILIAILGREAGAFSVPSKVTSYYCACRAILLAVPRENLAAQITVTNELGIVVEPDDTEGFCRAALALAADAERRTIIASNARRYAEQTFDIQSITSLFEEVFTASFQISK